ncbi:hypothetical protein YC2023_061328 [Brassica napus]
MQRDPKRVFEMQEGCQDHISSKYLAFSTNSRTKTTTFSQRNLHFQIRQSLVNSPARRAGQHIIIKKNCRSPQSSTTRKPSLPQPLGYRLRTALRPYQLTYKAIKDNAYGGTMLDLSIELNMLMPVNRTDVNDIIKAKLRK